MAALAQAERDVAELKVNSPETAKLASILQQRLTTAWKKLEDARKEKKAPFIKAGRDIDALADGPAGRITQAKTLLSKQLVAWDQLQEKLAREAEEARQKEISRLQEIARKEAAEAKRIADDLAAKQIEPSEDFDMIDAPEPVKTETEKRIEAVQFAPAKIIERPSGTTYKKTLRIKSTDVSKLPDLFVTKTANESAIRAGYCVGWKAGQPIPVVPGVVFEIDSQAISSGRAVF